LAEDNKEEEQEEQEANNQDIPFFEILRSKLTYSFSSQQIAATSIYD